MAEQLRKGKTAPTDAERRRAEVEAITEDDAARAETAHEAGERIKAELDELLDEIDELLDEHAEEFVRNYVQKGGQ